MTTTARAAVSVSVRYARQHHHFAMWARAMAKQHPHARQFYLAKAKHSKAQARQFMRSARKWRNAA